MHDLFELPNHSLFEGRQAESTSMLSSSFTTPGRAQSQQQARGGLSALSTPHSGSAARRTLTSARWRRARAAQARTLPRSCGVFNLGFQVLNIKFS